MHARLLCLAVLTAAAIAGAAPAAADPQPGSESAAATIDDLTAEGYNVEINWVNGVSSQPLSRCSVLAIHNPNLTGGPPQGFTTVYVDVNCPNHPDDAGFWLGGGVGFG
jgi:hypothetical protein